MADEEKETVEEAPKKKSPIILIVVLVIVGVLLASGISYFLMQQMMAGGMPGGEAGGGSRYHDPGVFIKLGDAKDGIVVNVGGPRSGKFLKAGIVLEMNPNKSDNIEEGKMLPAAETKILDTTMQMLRGTKLDDFDADKQDELKKRLKDELNHVLGEGSVYDIYITSFLLQ